MAKQKLSEMPEKELREASRIAKDAMAADKSGEHLGVALSILVVVEGELARRARKDSDG